MSLLVQLLFRLEASARLACQLTGVLFLRVLFKNSSQLKGARAVQVSSSPVIANSGFTLINISEASCKSAASQGSRRQVQLDPFLLESTRFWSGHIARPFPRRLIQICKLRLLQHGSISAYEKRAQRFREFRHPSFVGLEGSKPGRVYNGVCSKQHPPNQRKFRYFFW